MLRRRVAVCLGCLSAVPTLLLVINLGLLVDLVHSRHATVSGPWFWTFARWLQEAGVAGPWMNRYDSWLLLLVSTSVILALVEWALLLLYFRQVQIAALDTSLHLLKAVYEQSRRVEAPAWFAGSPAAQEHRLVDVCGRLRDALTQWWSVAPRAGTLVGLLLLLALSINFFLALLVVLLAVFLWRIYQRIQVHTQARLERYRTLVRTRGMQLLQNFHAAQTIAGFGGQVPESRSTGAAIERYRQEAARAVTTTSSLRPWVLLLSALGIAILLLVVGLSPGGTLAGTLVLMLAIARAAPPTARLGRVLVRMDEYQSLADELFAYLDKTPSVGQMAGAAALPRITRDVRWENVSLAGDEHPLLADVSLTVPAGQMAAFLSLDCGTPPALASLCLRYVDPEAGRILLDATDVRSVTLDSLRREVAVAAADGSLFTGTIEDNIRCGRAGYGGQQIERAAEICRVLDAVQNLPQALLTTVGPGGRDVAPSIAFRIGLARAVLGNPSLIIIEEPRGDLSDETIATLEAAMGQARTGRTVILLPSRLASLRAADRIFLFHQGRLHAEGKHAELLKQNALYRHLNYVLFTPFRDVVPCDQDHEADQPERHSVVLP
jgi:ABC-type multidrug transport system fused ATPase/permease subunit